MGRQPRYPVSPSVLLKDQRPHLILEGRGFEIRKPPVGRDCQPIGAEQHLPLQNRIGVADEDIGKVFRRPAGHVLVNIGLVLADGESLFGPEKAGMRQYDFHVRKIDRDVVQMHRVRILQPHAHSTAHS